MSEGTQTTRDAILVAALRLFSFKGFLASTTREIAKEAGVAEITLFRHFSSKEMLLEEVLSSFSIIPELRALQLEIKGKPSEEGLTFMANFLLNSMVERKEWIVLMQTELRRNPDKLLVAYHSFLDRVYAIIADYFRSQHEQRLMRSFDFELAARAFYGMIFNCFYTEEVLQRKLYRPTERALVVSSIVGLFLHGVST